MGNLTIHKIAVMGELLTRKKWSAKENLSDKCIPTPARCSEQANPFLCPGTFI